MIRFALYQPDIPHNVGAAMRLAACLGVPLDIIEPCGFPWDNRKIRAAALDYIDHVHLTRHASWHDFRHKTDQNRLILLTTKTDTAYWDFDFRPGDILLAGRESAGVPGDVHTAADARLAIPLFGAMRSLNVITASAMVLGEAMRQMETRNLR